MKRIIAKRTLREFWKNHADSEQYLKTWYETTKNSNWNSPNQVKMTYIKGKDDRGYSLRHVPPVYGDAALTYQKGKLNLTLDAAFNGQINYARLAPSERDKAFMYAKDENGQPYAPAWWTINFKGNYAFNKHFLLTSGIENMMNYRYRPYTSGISAPGINFIIALRFTF